MSPDKKKYQFTESLDPRLLPKPRRLVPAGGEAVAQTARLLIGLNLEADAAPRPGLRACWIQQTRKANPTRARQALFHPRMAWIVVLTVVLILLAVFHQPVFAEVERLFGYIYFPSTGFLPVNTTSVLEQGVIQEHDGVSLTVTQGVATPRETVLVLDFSETAHPGAGAWLETNTGSRLDLSAWEYFPNVSGSHGLRLTFPALPAGVRQTTLALPEGWRMLLTWLPAAQAHVLKVNVISYSSPTQSRGQADLCQSSHGLDLCILAATASGDQTVVLVESKIRHGNLRPGGGTFRLVQQSEDTPITIETLPGGQKLIGREIPTGIDSPTFQRQLIFPTLPAGEKSIRLSIPAVLASTDLNQFITVDMGADPQPGEILPIHADIQVMGTIVRFRKASFTGDGVNSLRLTLDSEPVESVDGVTPISLELGRPEGVDDLYGSGQLGLGKALFVELIQGDKKLAGILKLPIIQATVSLQGPFVFNFTISQSVPGLPTPVMDNPADFTPAFTPTPMPLEGYAYSGVPMQAGELLYSVIAADKTNLYIYQPGQIGQARWFATLPGVVGQVYIHPDRLGIDYLAGSQVSRDGTSYIESDGLYTLNFDESSPRLLYRFMPGLENGIGVSESGNWSYDGRLAVFALQQTAPGNATWKFIWLDLSCRSSGNCTAHAIAVRPDFSLSYPYFAPDDYRVLFSGLDTGEGGLPGIFLLDLNPPQSHPSVVKLSTNMPVSGNGPEPAIWTPDGKIFSTCWDGGRLPETDYLCKFDPATGIAAHGDALEVNLNGYRLYDSAYRLSPSGERLAEVLFPVRASNDSIPDLRLLDLDGHPGAVVASSFSISNIQFSPSGQTIAYMNGNGQQLEIYDIATAKNNPIFDGNIPGELSWVGWIK
ncbi:MAG TPA: hypothetical protein VMT91_02615 [Anaerolineales bacterium]|nr:hypothetical protein [Anaerolineales bacterium]